MISEAICWAHSGESHIDKAVRQASYQTEDLNLRFIGTLGCIIRMSKQSSRKNKSVNSSSPKHGVILNTTPFSLCLYSPLPLCGLETRNLYPSAKAQKLWCGLENRGQVMRIFDRQHRKVWSTDWEFCVYAHFNSDSGQEFILFGSTWHCNIFTQTWNTAKN